MRILGFFPDSIAWKDYWYRNPLKSWVKTSAPRVRFVRKWATLLISSVTYSILKTIHYWNISYHRYNSQQRVRIPSYLSDSSKTDYVLIHSLDEPNSRIHSDSIRYLQNTELFLKIHPVNQHLIEYDFSNFSDRVTFRGYRHLYVRWTDNSRGVFLYFLMSLIFEHEEAQE